MAPRTRRAASPKFVIERDEDSGESSSGEEEEVGNVFEDSENDDVEEEEVEETVKENKSREKRPITISLKKVCKVSFLL